MNTDSEVRQMIGRKGFSLVEALVSLFLIVVTGIVLLNLFPTSRKGLQLSENRLNATALGSNILEDARMKKFDDINELKGNFEYKGTDNDAPFSQRFDYILNVESINEDLKRVWVEVTWTETTGSKKATVETVRSRAGKS